MRTIAFDVTSEDGFKAVARRFGRALALFEAEARKPIRYAGKDLYHAFLIAIEGPPAAGKSSFIEFAALAYAEEKKREGYTLLTPLKKLWPDAEKQRDVKVWMRWQFVDADGGHFEIRSDDQKAVDNLYYEHRDVALPMLETPHIRFREWPDDDFLESARAAISIGYQDGRRLLKISIDPALEVDRIMEILQEASTAPCLNLSTSTANEPAPAC
ncbi:MAG TPA: hypothetical protein PLO23_06905 [Alphaproteobacteria bacterium]|nr:hypothetical protein [Alphaproteobacteria bacterium]